MQHHFILHHLSCCSPFFLNCILMTWFTWGPQIIVITWHLNSWQCGIHKGVFSAFQKLQNLEYFDELLINQVMMKMTPELRWTFPALVDRIWPSLWWCAWWYQYCGNSQFIINCFQATQKQRRNIDNGRVMVAVTPAQSRPQTLILKHLNTIWSSMKYGAYILLWILMILQPHKISFYLLATFVRLRIFRALFQGF